MIRRALSSGIFLWEVSAGVVRVLYCRARMVIEDRKERNGSKADGLMTDLVTWECGDRREGSVFKRSSDNNQLIYMETP